MDIKEIARKNVGPKDGNSPSEIIFNMLCAPYYVLTTLRRKFPCNVVVKGESLADTPSFLLEVAIVFQNHSYFPFSSTFKIVTSNFYSSLHGRVLVVIFYISTIV